METPTQGQQPATETATAQAQGDQSIASNLIELPLDPAGIAAALAKTKETSSGQTAGDEEEKKKVGSEESAISAIEEETPGEQLVEDPDADLVIEGEQETPVKRILPNRISTHQFAADEQEAIALLKELKEVDPNARLKDALDMIDRRKAATPAPDAQNQDRETKSQEKDALGELTSQRAELMQQRRQVAEVDPFDPALADLDEQLEAVRDEIAETRAINKLQQQQQQEQDAKGKERVINAREEVKQAALAIYPSADDQNTPLGREVVKVIAEWRDPANPNHALLYGVKAPRLVIDEAVERIATRVTKARGVTPEQVITSLRDKPSESSITQATQTTRPAVRPVSGASQTEPSPKTLAGNEFLSAVGFDPEAIATARKAQLRGANSAMVYR